MATMGQPPGGGVPLGVNTEPETTVGVPVSPDVERYSTRAARRSRASTRRVTPGMVVAVTSEPAPASVRSALSTGTGGPPADGKLFTNSRPSGTANGNSARPSRIWAMTTTKMVTVTAVRVSQRGLPLLRESRTSLRYRTVEIGPEASQ